MDNNNNNGQANAGADNVNQRQSSAGAAPTSSTTVVIATPVCNGHSSNPKEIKFTTIKAIGRGTFGEVVLARLHETNQSVAVKTVKQNITQLNRELSIMRRLTHSNVVTLHYFYHSEDMRNGDRYLHLVMEWMPETLASLLDRYVESQELISILHVKLFAYQMFLGLDYLHYQSICHRDIKPNNVLVDTEKGTLKICDFGCSKQLTGGQESTAYVCSRNYRAPELIFGSVNYTTKIDIWSAGCVFGEMLIGKILFPGVSRDSQVMTIFYVLGVPSRQEVTEMNPGFHFYDVLPRVTPVPWSQFLLPGTPATAFDLLAKLLRYGPSSRLNATEVCSHSFFDEMRLPPALLIPIFHQLPPLKPLNSGVPANGNVANVAGRHAPGPSSKPRV